jgi:hypothetical protein
MYKLVYNLEQKRVSINNYNDPDSKALLFRNAEVKFFYPEQIIEVHADDKFKAILPLGLTFVVFE